MLKSTCKKHIVGLLAESKVITLFKNKGYSLLKQRQKTPYGEVDLLFKGKNTVLMIEVKSMKSFVYLSQRQKISLKKSYYYFQCKYAYPVHFYLALVGKSRIHLIPEDLS